MRSAQVGQWLGWLSEAPRSWGGHVRDLLGGPDGVVAVMAAPVSAHDVAAVLRDQRQGMTKWQLHKLLYYVQGWHLARRGERAFSEKIMAWTDGPVVAALWAVEQHGLGRPAPRPVPAELVATIDYVVDRYGDQTGDELRWQTHREAPWADAQPKGAISDQALVEWFTVQAEADRLRERRMYRAESLTSAAIDARVNHFIDTN